MATSPTPRSDMVVYPDGTGYVVYPDGSWRSLDIAQVTLLTQYLDANPSITLASAALTNLDAFFGQPAYDPTAPPPRPSGGVVGPNPVPAAPLPGTTTATTTPNVGEQASVIAPTTTPSGIGAEAILEADKSARDIIASILDYYGLGSLTDLVFSEVTAGEAISEARVMAAIRQTSEYKERFAGNEMRRAAGKAVLSEAQYVQMEIAYAGILHSAGLPDGFYDSPDDFDQFIGGDVSLAELSQRIQAGYVAAINADPTVRQALRDLYGITEGELVAYMLDPDVALPLIEKQMATARVGAAAARAGLDVALGTLERVASVGVSEGAAMQGFTQISDEAQELYRPLDRTEDLITVEEAAGAAFLGDAAAARRIRQRRANRLAEFAGGGRYATDGSGISGLAKA